LANRLGLARRQLPGVQQSAEHLPLRQLPGGHGDRDMYASPVQVQGRWAEVASPPWSAEHPRLPAEVLSLWSRRRRPRGRRARGPCAEVGSAVRAGERPSTVAARIRLVADAIPVDLQHPLRAATLEPLGCWLDNAAGN